MEISLGYVLEGREGYWKARKYQGTWRLVKDSDNGYTEIPFPSKESLIEFLKEHNAKYVYFDIDSEKEIVKDVTE